MMKKEKIVWRLKELPTSANLQELVKTGILTKEEAREILFSSETVEERDAESLKGEIKFLRELVEKLSNRSQIVEMIKEIQPVYLRQNWYKPYYTWTDTVSNSKWETISTHVTPMNFSNITTF